MGRTSTPTTTPSNYAGISVGILTNPYNVFQLAGLGVLVMSVLAYVDNPLKGNIDDFINGTDLHAYNYAIYAAMAVGILVMLIGFMGCCGAIMESVCLLGLVRCVSLYIRLQ